MIIECNVVQNLSDFSLFQIFSQILWFLIPAYIPDFKCHWSLISELLVPPVGRVPRGEYGVKEATQGMAQMGLREQELRDMEVARKLQEEELKV